MFDIKPKKIVSVTSANYITDAGCYYYAGTAAATWYLPNRSQNAPLRRTDSGVFLVVCEINAGPLTITGLDANFSYNPTASTSITIMPGESALIHDDGGFWIASMIPSPPRFQRVATTQSGTTATLDRSGSMWTFTGTTAATWTLPSLALNKGIEYVIKNKGTVDLTIQRAGADQIYTISAVNSITVTAGSSVRIINDGVHWSVV